MGLMGLMYALFWGGTIVVFLVMLCLRLLLPRSRRRELLQGILGAGLRLFFRITRWCGLVRARIEFERPAPEMPDVTALLSQRRPLTNGLVLAGNHPSLLDALLILSRFPHTACIFKSDLRRSALLRFFVHELGFVAHADSISVISDCVRIVKDEGRPLLFFPEGSRSPPGGLHPLSRGAATVALRAGVPLVPVQFSCSPVILSKEQRWFEIPGGCVDLAACVCYPLKAGTPVESSPVPTERDLAQELTIVLEQKLLKAVDTQ
jgi:1-acyl-sn-glycerol-3-phosphate acyltransferase